VEIIALGLFILMSRVCRLKTLNTCKVPLFVFLGGITSDWVFWIPFVITGSLIDGIMLSLVFWKLVWRLSRSLKRKANIR